MAGRTLRTLVASAGALLAVGVLGRCADASGAEPETKRFDTALKVTANDGRFVVRDVSGPLDLRSDDWSVSATGVASRQVAATAKDGKVRLAFTRVPDRVDVRADDGSIDVSLPDAAYAVSATADDGA